VVYNFSTEELYYVNNEERPFPHCEIMKDFLQNSLFQTKSKYLEKELPTSLVGTTADSYNRELRKHSWHSSKDRFPSLNAPNQVFQETPFSESMQIHACLAEEVQ
jgi:hypothetical protein